MYTYTEKALSKAEISVIPGKNPDESNWYKVYTFKQSSNLKNIINFIYIFKSIQKIFWFWLVDRSSIQISVDFSKNNLKQKETTEHTSCLEQTST